MNRKANRVLMVLSGAGMLPAGWHFPAGWAALSAAALAASIRPAARLLKERRAAGVSAPGFAGAVPVLTAVLLACGLVPFWVLCEALPLPVTWRPGHSSRP